MYIYCVLINTLSAHIIHINLDMIDILYTCTDVEHSPIKNNLHKVFYGNTHTLQWIWMCMILISIIHHTCTHTLSICFTLEQKLGNWVLILVGAKILWEEEGFQFGFKRWQGWTVSQVLWEWIPNVGSKAREGAKAMMSLAFLLLVFQYVGVRRRA